MLHVLVVEDNEKLRPALQAGLESTGVVHVIYGCGSGEEALEYCLVQPPEVILMDVQLAGEMNGIETAVAVRREQPRLPVVFYSIQDDDAYYRDFRRSGILSHYAYVRKSNYLLAWVFVISVLLAELTARSIQPGASTKQRRMKKWLVPAWQSSSTQGSLSPGMRLGRLRS